MTKANIFFFEFEQFVTLRLKTSKTDINDTGVPIVVKEIHQQNGPLTTLCKLFFRNLQPADTPLFNQI